MEPKALQTGRRDVDAATCLADLDSSMGSLISHHSRYDSKAGGGAEHFYLK